MPLTVLDGSTFCISDDLGDVAEGSAGLYSDDTRHLSRLLLTIDGRRPLLLASRNVEYFTAAFYLRNRPTPAVPPNALLITRERFVGRELQDRLTVRNQTRGTIACEIALELAADFADIITVKEHEIAAGDAAGLRPLPPPGERRLDPGGSELLLVDTEDGGARTQVLFSRPAAFEGDRARWSIELAPGERWELGLEIAPLAGGAAVHDRRQLERGLAESRRLAGESLETWCACLPRLTCSWETLRRAYERSVLDLAALRLPGSDALARLPAAGAPWFMTVFGRDTIIASLQSLGYGHGPATATLERLAELQARADDPRSDAEPGKIIHELRGGKAAPVWFPRYYGTIDATPLYLILLSELWRWTDDAELVARFREPALQALAWIDRYGDRDGDGFVEYERRTPRGLPNQSWKDSHDSQRFSDGSLAHTPLAPCEAQGYVFDAKRRLAEIARDGWNDPALADRLDSEALELRERFDRAYWVDRRGGYYALALDGEKRQVDSLSSNIGHLLWSGIVPESRADAIVEALLGDELWSGWGVRTMSTGDAGFNPLGYHIGTVWPHDGSLIAQGLARYGRWEEAFRVARGAARGGAVLRLPAPRGLRGARAERDAVPGPVSDRGLSAGLGGRRRPPAAAGAARASARPPDEDARGRRAGRRVRMARHRATVRSPRVRPLVGRLARGRPHARDGGLSLTRRPARPLSPGAAAAAAVSAGA